jgi:hypothetical protein
LTTEWNIALKKDRWQRPSSAGAQEGSVSRPVVFLVVCFSAREFGCLMVKDDATVFESGPRTKKPST